MLNRSRPRFVCAGGGCPSHPPERGTAHPIFSPSHSPHGVGANPAQLPGSARDQRDLQFVAGQPRAKQAARRTPAAAGCRCVRSQCPAVLPARSARRLLARCRLPAWRSPAAPAPPVTPTSSDSRRAPSVWRLYGLPAALALPQAMSVNGIRARSNPASGGMPHEEPADAPECAPSSSWMATHRSEPR